MHIGIISDIHANLHALRAVLHAVDGVDQICCAGDLTGYYTHPNEVIEICIAQQMRWIAGNHDVYLRQPPTNANAALRASVEFTKRKITPVNADLLAAAPCEMRMTLDGLRIAMFHGSPWDPQEQYVYPDFADWPRFASVDADVIILGHTHRPVWREVEGRLLINPGSVGQPRDGDARASYAILDTATRNVQFRRAEFDAEAANCEALAAELSVRRKKETP